MANFKSTYKAPWARKAEPTEPEPTESTEDSSLPSLDEKESAEPETETPLQEGKVSLHIEHKDGKTSDHEFEKLAHLKDSLDKFFSSEEHEWKEDPEEEEKAHSGDFDSDEKEANPFSDFKSILGK